ncbi:polysaccharide biosynthesis tyrosine autokinase [Roseiconus lacunae]|uniref:non-specific protein-tyrosine kinase n=1 Tax=Roseiconus lacunae TaxID=2605694 RepID=A0ABT7PQS8_9BACT|nr:polysaccharide biosynthesis tyrosine autokinase [Roseiconus lacunae]MDM4018864.1 polysaccharide biosynthesis tyrosine autokinase [Roseiconus lacunae]
MQQQYPRQQQPTGQPGGYLGGQPAGYIGGPTAAPGSDASSFDPWLIWVTFRRCWHWAVPAGLVLASITAFAVLSTFEPQFEASYRLESNKDWLLDRGVMPTPDDLARSEGPILTSPIVLSSIMANETLHQYSLADPETREQTLLARLKVRSGGTNSTMVVTYTDAGKEFAADVCNAVVAAYLQKRDEYDNLRISRLTQYLGRQIDDLKRRVEEQKEIVANYAREASGAAPGERVAEIESAESFQLIEQLRRQISEVEIELAMIDAGVGIRNPSARDQIEPTSYAQFIPPHIPVVKGKVDESRLESMIEKDEDVKFATERYELYRQEVLKMEVSEGWRTAQDFFEQQKQKRDEWKDKLDEARNKASAAAVAILDSELEDEYQVQLKERDAEIERRRKEFAAFSDIKEKELVGRADLMSEQEQEEIKERRKQLALQLSVYQKQYDDEADRLRRRDSNNVALEFAKTDLDQSFEMLARVTARLDSIQLESQRGSSVISVAKATPPTRPVEDMPFKKMVVAGGAGFAVPFLIGLLWEFRVKRITDSHELERSIMLAPVVGELARAPSANGGRNSKGRRVFEESVDSLRANLALSKGTRDARSFAIVSSMSGEGKSTAVSQLAISLAKACGKTVLIIDADMRCPDQHDVFGLSLEPGLNEVLREVVDFDEAVNKELGDLVHVLPAGRLKASPHRLLSTSSMRELLDKAFEKYAYVIIDTAPVLSAGETLAVASAVDSTLVCVMRDLTRMDSVVRTTHRLEASGANVVGTIFSGVTHRQYSYRYGDYRYSDFTELVTSGSAATIEQ